MVQALFLAARTRIKAANLIGEIADFLRIAHLPPGGAILSNDFFFCPFDYSSGPARFKHEFQDELSDGLFLDYGIGRIVGEPYTLDDLLPCYESPLRERATLNYEDSTWTEYLKRLARNYGHDPFARPTRLKLLLVYLQDEGVMDSKAIRTLRKHLGPKARYHWQTPSTFVASVQYAASPETLCKSLGDVLTSDIVSDFAAFELGAEYASALGGLNTLESWINQTLSSRPMPPQPAKLPKRDFVVERLRRPIRKGKI